MLQLKHFYLRWKQNRYMKHFKHFALYHSLQAQYDRLAPFLKSEFSLRFPDPLQGDKPELG
jgi:hypothetical protein